MLKKLALIVTTGVVAASFAMNITVSSDANALAAALLGEGITLVGDAALTGGPTSTGLYTGAENFITQGVSTLENGIVLSSGDVGCLANASNMSKGTSTDFGGSGDNDLNNLFPDYTTYDASVLEFDFEVTGEGNVTSSFWYVFGSDEYFEFVGTIYNDLLGFFVDGENVALIPGTTTPISTNTINENSYSEYYIQNNGIYATEMDGYTTAFYSEFTLDAGTTHHMKIAIADATDNVVDSWVVLGGDSFINKPHSVPEPGSLFLIAIGMLSLAGYGIRRKK